MESGGTFLDDKETSCVASYISGPMLESPPRSFKVVDACMLSEEMKTLLLKRFWTIQQNAGGRQGGEWDLNFGELGFDWDG